MKFQLGGISDSREIEITCDHSASSYGIHVAIINGRAYGLGDLISPEDAFGEGRNKDLDWIGPEFVAAHIGNIWKKASQEMRAFMEGRPISSILREEQGIGEDEER